MAPPSKLPRRKDANPSKDIRNEPQSPTKGAALSALLPLVDDENESSSSDTSEALSSTNQQQALPADDSMKYNYDDPSGRQHKTGPASSLQIPLVSLSAGRQA